MFTSLYGRKSVKCHEGLLWHGVLTGAERRTDGATQANTLRGEARSAAAPVVMCHRPPPA